MPVWGSVSLELEQVVVCTHGQPWVGSKIAECNHVVHSYVFQSQVDHRNLAGYGVAADSCTFVWVPSDISMFTGLLIALILHLPSHRGSSFPAVGTDNQTESPTEKFGEEVCWS